MEDRNTTSRLLKDLGIGEAELEGIREFYKIGAVVTSVSPNIDMKGVDSDNWRSTGDCERYLRANNVNFDRVEKKDIDYTAIKGRVSCKFSGIPF